MKQLKIEAKEQKGECLSTYLGILCASLLGNLLTGKGVIATSQRRGTIKAGEGIIRVGKGTIIVGQDF